MKESHFKDTAVVVEQETLEKAYEMGFDRFEGMTENDPQDLSDFKESETWANTVSPSLRAMAGFADRGHGTYQEGREIVLADERELDDRPIEGETSDAAYFYQSVVEAFDNGAYDGAYNHEHGENLYF